MIHNSVVDLETTRDHKCVDEKVDKKNGILRFKLDILALHVGLCIAALAILHRSSDSDRLHLHKCQK